ncbi:polyunsaturated fatty acid lipoxygenase ALOX15B-like isoform X2 [Paroedura picta]|uniref:polyunsaturated fatty acid lipoxygenase ALOX15B-like isoform X2 n=1 Tax=Paroedura picta TaxID=143630 RepID=UPI0040577308
MLRPSPETPDPGNAGSQPPAMRLKVFRSWKENWRRLEGLSSLPGFTKAPGAAGNHAEHWGKEGGRGNRWSLHGGNPATIQQGCKSKAHFSGAWGTKDASLGESSHGQKDLKPPACSEESSRRARQGESQSGGKPMANYKVQVATGKLWGSGTFSSVSITLVGSKGQSPKQLLNRAGKDFLPGAVDEYEVSSDQDLGPLLLIRVHKEPYLFFPEDGWYLRFIRLTTPQEETYCFPCYQWIEGPQTLELREGTGKLASEDAESPLLLCHRAEERKVRQDCYSWAEFAPGMPRCLAVESIEEMDTNIKFSFTKLSTFLLRSKLTKVEMKLKGLLGCQQSWKKMEDIRRVFWFNKTEVSEYVADHWMDDAFFGYQYLNGVNPAVIQKCTEIPAHFPVTQEMVAPSLAEGTTLQEELQKGNVFLVDYELLQDVPTNTIQGQRQYMAVPLCLLYQTPSGELRPIAIQLSQPPGPDSPIFLPSDPEGDWTLAKMWVRNADFQIHQNVFHLLRTHLLAEVFALATLRQLPMCHPVFKLLIPHLRYTLQINAFARVRLIMEGGMMDQATSAGHKGIAAIVGKGTQAMTYASLCLPDDIEARGVASVSNYYYRDDGLKIWACIESFVLDIVRFYYKDDGHVQRDPEIQAWVLEIFQEAFKSRKSSGAPSSLETVAELTRFLTMVIFTCSAQHAAVNSGQYDFGAWIPNIPPSMRRPPPTVKGTVTLEHILETLPPINVTCVALSSLWLLSNEAGDRRPLGYYPDEHFTEEEPKQFIKAFQGHLAEISEEIKERNRSLPLPYNYLNPPEIENSISI